jgi:hypothetical protein
MEERSGRGAVMRVEGQMRLAEGMVWRRMKRRRGSMNFHM